MTRATFLIVLAALVAVVAVLLLRGAGISAVRHSSWPLEERAATAAWRFLVPAEMRSAANPVPASPEVLKEAREHWADHCALCHDNDGSGRTTVGERVYPRAPDMRGPGTQELTDGELFYAIEQGIPWTAMPGWTNGTEEGERESWALVRFIRHLPAITPEEVEEMERLNPRSPPDPALEQEIDSFLKGGR